MFRKYILIGVSSISLYLELKTFERFGLMVFTYSHFVWNGRKFDVSLVVSLVCRSQWGEGCVRQCCRLHEDVTICGPPRRPPPQTPQTHHPSPLEYQSLWTICVIITLILLSSTLLGRLNRLVCWLFLRQHII